RALGLAQARREQALNTPLERVQFETGCVEILAASRFVRSFSCRNDRFISLRFLPCYCGLPLLLCVLISTESRDGGHSLCWLVSACSDSFLTPKAHMRTRAGGRRDSSTSADPIPSRRRSSGLRPRESRVAVTRRRTIGSVLRNTSPGDRWRRF